MTLPMARYRIGTVAKLTGLSTHAVRAWQRRYGAVRPGRSAAGDRLYSDADVERLKLLRRLQEMGHGIGQIARLPTDGLKRLLTYAEGELAAGAVFDARQSVETYLQAIERMDLPDAERLLSVASSALSPERFVKDVLVTILERLGERWQRGEICVAHEHAASAMIRHHLGGLLRAYSPAPGAPVVLSTTPSGEHHELGALLSAVTATLLGFRAVYFGPDLPSPEIERAAAATKARVVLLSVIAPATRQIKRELVELTRRLPAPVAIGAGGRGLERLKALPPRIGRLRDLDELEAFLKSVLSVRPPAGRRRNWESAGFSAEPH